VTLHVLQAVLPHLKEGSSIINTSSVNAYKGNASLIPYTSTKGAEVSSALAMPGLWFWL
jgi:NAD(P)-dependent dehydrogenase (short-subunit alcohol dehydrogenase family)